MPHSFPQNFEHLKKDWDAEASRIRAALDFSADGIGPLLRAGHPFNVAGLDISFFKDDEEKAVVSVAVIEYPSMKILRTVCQITRLTVPYISGYLAFRECGPMVNLLKLVVEGAPIPQGEVSGATSPPADPLPVHLVVVDGNGVWHPQFVGLACHVSAAAQIPAIGVAKKFLDADGATRARYEDSIKRAFADAARGVEGCAATAVAAPPLGGARSGENSDGDGIHTASDAQQPAPATSGPSESVHLIPPQSSTAVGFHVPSHVVVRGDSGMVLGAAVVPSGSHRSSGFRGPKPSNPVYVSVGDRCSLEAALCVVEGMSVHRVVEPVRVADAASRMFVSEVEKQLAGAVNASV